jgi:hypothetical protein
MRSQEDFVATKSLKLNWKIIRFLTKFFENHMFFMFSLIVFVSFFKFETHDADTKLIIFWFKVSSAQLRKRALETYFYLIFVTSANKTTKFLLKNFWKKSGFSKIKLMRKSVKFEILSNYFRWPHAELSFKWNKNKINNLMLVLW